MKRLKFALLVLTVCIIAATYFISIHVKTNRSLISGGEEGEGEGRYYFNIHSWQDFAPKSSTEIKKRVIYNRVGKCGSRTMIQLMITLARKHNYRVIGSTKYKLLHINLLEQVKFVGFIDQLEAPFIYHHHLHYVDFGRFGSLQPIYINLIRDPLGRMVSGYYFRRFGDYRQGHLRTWEYKGTEEEKNQTFDSCVLQNKPECVNPQRIFYIIPHFCGHEPMCRQPSQWALNQAKYNVIKNFLVVGVTSEFESFLEVLENILPEFFAGASEIYKSPGDELKDRMTTTKTLRKKGPSAEVEKIMKNLLKLEYEFYYFVKKRFHHLKVDLGLQKESDEDT